MKALNSVRLMAIISCAGFVLALTPGLPAQAPSPALATITLTKQNGIEIDEEKLNAARKQGVVWFIDNQTDDEDEIEVKLTNFQIGKESGGKCTELKKMEKPPLRGKLDAKVEENGTGIIAVVVKKNTVKTCYKYDITATGLSDLDPRLDVH